MRKYYGSPSPIKKRSLGKSITALVAVGTLFYAGTKWQQFLDSRKPYQIINKEGIYLFLDQQKQLKFPASTLSDMYQALAQAKPADEHNQGYFSQFKEKTDHTLDKLLRVLKGDE